MVSIIFVNWNCIKDIEATMLHIEKFPPKVEYEYIIIDNGSDDFLAWINGKSIIHFRLEQNMGYGCAANIGIILSHGKYVALLNPDLRPQEGWLDILIEHLESNTGIGLIAPAATNTCNPDQGRAITTKEICVARSVIPFVCVIIPKKVFSEIGFISPNYGEDINFCNRVNSANLKCVIVGTAFVDHFLNVSFIRNNIGRAWENQIKYVREVVEPRFLGR